MLSAQLLLFAVSRRYEEWADIQCKDADLMRFALHYGPINHKNPFNLLSQKL
jgi:hypothetical protein